MPQDNTQRRKKKVGAATHRTGTLRATVNPNVTSRSDVVDRAITQFMNSLAQGSTTQTAWGDRLDLVADLLRDNYGLGPREELYLLLDLNRTGGGETGMLLSESGLRLRGGTAGTVVLSWDDFAKTQVGLNQGVLVIGQSGLMADDAQVIAALLQQIQSALGN